MKNYCLVSKQASQHQRRCLLCPPPSRSWCASSANSPSARPRPSSSTAPRSTGWASVPGRGSSSCQCQAPQPSSSVWAQTGKDYCEQGELEWGRYDLKDMELLSFQETSFLVPSLNTESFPCLWLQLNSEFYRHSILLWNFVKLCAKASFSLFLILLDCDQSEAFISNSDQSQGSADVYPGASEGGAEAGDQGHDDGQPQAPRGQWPWQWTEARASGASDTWQC